MQILGAQLQIAPFPLWRLEAALCPGPHATAEQTLRPPGNEVSEVVPSEPALAVTLHKDSAETEIQNTSSSKHTKGEEEKVDEQTADIGQYNEPNGAEKEDEAGFVQPSDKGLGQEATASGPAVSNGRAPGKSTPGDVSEVG